MDIRYLVAFQTILETGSFSKAANQLGYTQAAITFQIQQLEQELGIKLFERIGRNIQLTESGRQILPLAKQITDTFQVMKETGHGDNELTGKLTVAASESLMPYLYETMHRFKELAPKIKIALWSEPCCNIVNSLKSNTCDIGILYASGEPDKMLYIKSLIQMPMKLVGYAGTDIPFDFTCPNQSIHTTFLINEPQCVFRKVFEKYLRQKNITLDDTVEVGSIEAIRQSISRNFGISFLPEFIIKRDLDDGIFRELPMGKTSEKVTLAYALHKNKCRTRAMELFLQLFEHNVTNDTATL